MDQKKKLIRIDWQHYDKLIDSLVRKLKKKTRIKYRTISGISRGGLVPAVSISHRLGGSSVVMDFNKKDVDIVVDDILDSGMTYRRIFNHQKHKPACFAVLCIKKSQIGRYSNVIHAMAVEDNAWVVFPWENRAERLIRKDIKAYLKKIKGQ
jgi:uncharacterized protein